LTDLGITDTSTAAAVDVLLRAAIGSSAEVLVVDAGAPGAPEGGIGALLRFDPAAATSDTV
jgi:hypothetical protein